MSAACCDSRRQFLSLFPPFLEETHALASTVCAPQVASTGAVVAAVFRPVVAVSTSSDACASEKIN